MYQFIAKITRMDSLGDSTICHLIEINTVSLDAESMNNEPEELFAWKAAVTQALSLCKGNESLDSVTLLSC